MNGDPKSLTASSMIRSHSVSGDLHGVPPDPVAADILRKEPEQETFVRLKITPTGRFLAELTKQVFSDLSASKYQIWREEMRQVYLGKAVLPKEVEK
ncbi:hypothetical protein GW17_00021305 [Ensete ventricosum]|nr:hypothetical protein GW17_00021305 [Ensete ventricosum]